MVRYVNMKMLLKVNICQTRKDIDCYVFAAIDTSHLESGLVGSAGFGMGVSCNYKGLFLSDYKW